jgi:transketolase
LQKPFNPNNLRKKVLEMAYYGSTVHVACAFSIIELLSVLYRKYLNYPGNLPNSEDRDYLILSKGHGVMAQYACMLEKGWLDEESHVLKYCSDGSELKGLSDSRIDGLEVTSGSLGHGFSIGVGISFGLKILKSEQKVYCIIGDGEINEGPIWEGLLFAAHHKLDNLMLIVDKNGFQAMGKTDEILNLGNLENKLNSFGFDTISIDGHNEDIIDNSINSLWSNGLIKPKAIVANTTKGKGVSFMESNNLWHYTRLDDKTYHEALSELNLL